MSVIHWGGHKCYPQSYSTATKGAIYKCHCNRLWVYSWAGDWTPLRWWHFRAKAMLRGINEDES